MPIYTWKNKQTGEVIEVIRSLAESDVPPEGEGDWEKQLQPTAVKKGDNWGGGKGNW